MTPILDLIQQKADEHGVSRRLALALAWAESEFNAEAERWGGYQPRQWGGEAQVLDILKQAGSYDISFGLFQQTWRWSDAYLRTGVQGDGLAWSLPHILSFRAEMLVPEVACDDALPKLRRLSEHWGDDLLVLCAWNRPSNPHSVAPGVLRRYQQGLEEADRILQRGRDMEFQLGFKELADRLGSNTVGEPLTEELEVGPARVQFTTKGMMMWAPGGPALFLVGSAGY